ncbi:MAG: type III-B CRISPR module RAMP protein Cmr4 [Chitinophagales bacterium]|nr:type III-B CRISPR module RAMP protein Cmr4 [Chitinophagales bacterium]
MQQSSEVLFLLCETPLHAGSGSDLGLIDLPIQRERHTGFPKVEGSSLKGALREAFEKSKKADKTARNHEIMVHRIFGYDDTNAHEVVKRNPRFLNQEDQQFRGCLTVTDCRLLLFPVKSQKGVCVWITCPRVVTKFCNEMAQIEQNEMAQIEQNEMAQIEQKVTFEIKADTASSNLSLIDDKVGIEEFIYGGIKVEEATTNFAEHIAKQFFPKNDYMYNLIKNNVVVLPDNDFAQLTELCTEVITRTKINNTTGTVAQGQLFNEEYLPQETILYSLVLFENEFAKEDTANAKKEKPKTFEEVKQFYEKHLPQHFQLGGNATIGKGIVKTNLKSPKTQTQENAN